jgi:hypothetical protein
MERWFIIPRNRYFNIYLHKFIGDDDARALHDHPWWSLSLLIKGSLYEYTKNDLTNSAYNVTPIERWAVTFRHAKYAHRLSLKSKVAWTIFITGKNKHEWGFHCPNGWQHWSTMTDKKGNQIGGCK